jgi:hypothetical protein
LGCFFFLKAKWQIFTTNKIINSITMCHYKNAIQCIAKSIEWFQLSLFLFIYCMIF